MPALENSASSCLHRFIRSLRQHRPFGVTFATMIRDKIFLLTLTRSCYYLKFMIIDKPHFDVDFYDEPHTLKRDNAPVAAQIFGALCKDRQTTGSRGWHERVVQSSSKDWRLIVDFSYQKFIHWAHAALSQYVVLIRIIGFTLFPGMGFTLIIFRYVILLHMHYGIASNCLLKNNYW